MKKSLVSILMLIALNAAFAQSSSDTMTYGVATASVTALQAQILSQSNLIIGLQGETNSFYQASNPSGFATNGLSISSYTNTPVRSIVTTAAAANGWQLSATHWSSANYSVTIVATSTISGSQVGIVVFEIAATDSVTASDWKEVARTPNGTALSLAVVLQNVGTGGSASGAWIPPGYWLRLRSISSSGTPSFTFNSGQELLF